MTLRQMMLVKSFNSKCAASDKKRDEGLTVPEEIEVFKDIPYGKHPKNNILDVYRRRGLQGYLPVLVSCHGGGYVYGDKELYSFYTMEFAKEGFAVVNFNYTLYPHMTYPSPIFETNEVMDWVVANNDKYGFDIDNVFFIGDSAGAQLASQYALCVTNKKYAELMKISIPPFRLRAISLGCGIYELSKKGSKTSPYEKMYLGKNRRKCAEQFKISEYIDENYPPTFLMTSPGDFLKDNQDPFKAVLSRAGVPCKARVYGNEHTYHVFFIDIRSNLGKVANRDQVEFLKRYLVIK